MMRYLKLTSLLLGLNAAVYVIAFFAAIYLSKDCGFTNTPQWQCGGDTNPLLVPIILTVVLPPLMAKWLLGKFKIKFSWKTILLAQLVALLVAYVVTWLVDPSNHPTGA